MIGIHIADDFINASGCFNVVRAHPLARLGYLDYTSVDNAFELLIPGFRPGQIVEYLKDSVRKP